MPANDLYRYDGITFRNARLWELMKLDGSFEVQAQWFAAADYGLFQVIPETARTAIFSVPSAQQRAAILLLYDPRHDSPEALFNPATAAQVGAMIDGGERVTAELGGPLADPDPEPACTPADAVTNCSWERFWRRRFRLFSTGLETGRPPSVNNPDYNCNNIPYDACVIAAAKDEFLPTK